MRLRRIDRGALTLASAEVKFQIDTETHDPLDIGKSCEWRLEKFNLSTDHAAGSCQMNPQRSNVHLLSRYPVLFSSLISTSVVVIILFYTTMDNVPPFEK